MHVCFTANMVLMMRFRLLLSNAKSCFSRELFSKSFVMEKLVLSVIFIKKVARLK